MKFIGRFTRKGKGGKRLGAVGGAVQRSKPMSDEALSNATARLVNRPSDRWELQPQPAHAHLPRATVSPEPREPRCSTVPALSARSAGRFVDAQIQRAAVGRRERGLQSNDGRVGPGIRPWPLGRRRSAGEGRRRRWGSRSAMTAASRIPRAGRDSSESSRRPARTTKRRRLGRADSGRWPTARTSCRLRAAASSIASRDRHRSWPGPRGRPAAGPLRKSIAMRWKS